MSGVVMLPEIATSSVLWLPLTVGIYWASSELHRRVGKSPLLNPTLRRSPPSAPRWSP